MHSLGETTPTKNDIASWHLQTAITISFGVLLLYCLGFSLGSYLATFESVEEMETVMDRIYDDRTRSVADTPRGWFIASKSDCLLDDLARMTQDKLQYRGE